MSYHPWSRKEMDMTELIFFFFIDRISLAPHTTL